MGDGPSESWTGKGSRNGIRITPTCPFCEEVLSDWSWLLDECWKCGKSGMDEENLRQMRVRARWAGRRLANRIWDIRMKSIFGSEGEPK